ncbi:hypothetical protein HMPREF9332_00228 [Alloprevotella rava F0323]|uniref:4Fe-4S ferredoxin-type domain-containing protein n=1 Tax=Alloprevotella rava F0323 TaxID=679199 RepID=G5G9H7_9BACT|nr:EFR1 family ferrodoxin [Alloprevotella rava]EHG24391.1 hypothetical protein HMPREF9332_00228 [Alloprevotella rava F0323]
MIICFSGTGNTRWAANKIAALTEDAGIEHFSSEQRGDILGIFFPIYAWGIPRIFINKLHQFFRNPENQGKFSYVYVVCTCGDDIGLTDKEVKSLLQQYGLNNISICSIQMPETYIDLPGFKLDTHVAATKKIAEAEKLLSVFAKKIQRQEIFNEVNRGTCPWIKSRILRPLFYKLFVDDKKFVVDKDLCIHCGKCAKVCPVHNIDCSPTNLPQYKHHCTGCLACYHHCPKNAIQRVYTKGKGQYLPPLF